MIIKGNSRGNPKQLAAHLLRADKNERIKILELNSPTDDLAATFRDWQLLTTATQGTKGLYHANISPGTDYTMTEEQWIRAADVLAEQLGLSHQPRAIYLHEKKGREHIHVVWQRTDTDSMTLVSDSWNYLAHEAASLALEKEFGHELVPGKHAKRDREKQPDFPRSEINHAEWQQAERSGIDPAERKEQITALFKQSDSGQAFTAALAEQGYILAQGDRRDFVIVDTAGEIYSLGRQIEGVKAKELRAFMADIDRETLPTAEQAKALQQETVQQPHQPPPEPVETPAALTQSEIQAIKKAVDDRHAQEVQRLKEYHQTEIKQLIEVYDREIAEKLADRRAMQQAELSKYFRKPEEFSDDWIKKYIDIMKQRWNPDAAEQQRLKREQEIEAIKTRHRIERETATQTLKLQRDQEIQDLKERHAQKLRDMKAQTEAEAARYIREEQAAKRLLADLEKQQKEDRQQKHDPPKPSL